MPKQAKYKLKALSTTDEKVGERIARARKAKGLTQTELGNRIGISQKLVTAYENNYAHLYDGMLASFCIALNVSADVLLGLKKNGNTKISVPSLRIMRRMKEIDKLPEVKKKAILRMLDDIIKANK